MSIIFEHPLKEHIKVLLRLERLFADLDNQMRFGTDPGLVLSLMAAIIRGLERPDLKSKLTNILHQQHLHLKLFANNPSIEQNKLNTMLSKIEKKLSLLKSHNSMSAFMPEPHPLMKKYQAELVSHGAVALVADPMFFAWDEIKLDDAVLLLNNWRLELDELLSIIQLILSLIRQGKSFQTVECNSHFYNHTFNSEISMIRVRLPKGVYPEFCAGGRRIGIRFLELKFLGPKINTKEIAINKFDISFCI